LELLELLKKNTGKYPKTFFSSWRMADQRVYVSDISKINRMLDWRPLIRPEEGVTKMIKFVTDNMNLFV
jgi:CDP-paratose 2-epimerase